jgi:hypothetical protein
MEKKKIMIEEIIKECRKQNKDYILSKTGENETLIYTYKEGVYRNIIIDDDFDIEYLYIPEDRSKSFNEYFSEKDINIKELVSRL